MAASSRPTLRRHLGVLVAGAVVVTSLTAVTAAAAPPAPMGAPPGVRVPGASLALGPMGSNDPELGSRRTALKPADSPGAFIYRKGRYTPLDTLNGRPTAHTSINDRGQIIGLYENPDATPRPQRDDLSPMGRGS
jgi:hypothetical protein